MATIRNIGETVSYEINMSVTEPDLMGHVEVKLESQNYQSNSSYLSIKLYLYKSNANNPINNTTFTGSIGLPDYPYNLTSNYNKYITSLGTSKILVASTNFTVSHKIDGTYSSTINIVCGYIGHTNTSNSESIVLPTISVSIPFSMSPYTEIRTTSGYVYVNIAGGNYHNYSYTMKIRNTNGDTYTLFSDITSLYWRGELPNEVNALFPNSDRATLYFDLIPKTPLGVQLATYTDYRTVIVGWNAGPSIDTTSIVDSPVNADGTPYSGGGYIAGVTYLKLIIPCADYSGSTVDSVKTVIDGRECVATLLLGSNNQYQILTRYPLGTSGNLTLSIVATNKRGTSSTATYTVQDIEPYFIPEINIFSVIRCDSNGVATSYSHNIKINFKFTVRATVPNVFSNSYEYYIYYRVHGTDNWTNFESDTGPATATSGNLCVVTGDLVKLNLLPNDEEVYDIKLLIKDTLTGNVGTEVYKIVVCGAEQVILDFMYDGSAAAVGKTAEDSGIFDIGWTARFSGGLYPKKIVDSESTYDLNNLKSPGFYYYSATEGGTLTNYPPALGTLSGNYGITVFPTGVSSVLQLFIPEAVGSDPSMYMRTVSSTTQVSNWKVITGA